MSGIIILFLVVYLFASVVESTIKKHAMRRTLLWLTLSGWFLLLLFNSADLQPWERLLFGCVGTLWLIKLCVRGTRSNEECPKLTVLDESIYRFIWPGMSLSPFVQKESPDQGDGGLFVRGYVSVLIGIALMIILAILSSNFNDSVLGLIGIVPFFMILHFGYAPILTSLLRLSKYPVQLLFEGPLHSTSLGDFWSKRWNRPFVEMNRKLFFHDLSTKFGRPVAVLATFVISGLLHELGISFPAGGGWGMPTVYFLFHGILVLLEEKKSHWFSQWPIVAKRVWVWSSLILPLPLLFHPEFRTALIIPAYRNLGAFFLNFPMQTYFELLVLLAGLGHFLILGASLQVPVRLGWKEDLAKLKPFNTKIMWNYGFFILVLIVAFGVETLLFRHDMVSGVPSALGLAGLICGFWLLRILVDCFYFSHSDWPEGPEFVIGHALLNSLFAFLVLTYGSLLGWHWWLSR